MPIALEVGLDVLNGKFKKTVGLVDTPAIYISTKLSSNEGSTCNNGIELRAGIKNKIHVAALDLWDYQIRDDVLYEKGITCVTYVLPLISQQRVMEIVPNIILTAPKGFSQMQ